MHRYINLHPYRCALFFWFLFFFFNIPAGVIGLMIPMELLALVTLADATVAIGGIVLVLALCWWEKTGFGTIGNRSDLILYLLPAAIALIQIAGAGSIPLPSTVLLFAAFSFTVGFAEETFFRGLILTALLTTGAWRAVILSSLLFAVPHLFNAAVGIWDPLYTLADTFAAFGIGMTFAALRIRTGTIWPLIGLHALINFTALFALGSLWIMAQSVVQLVTTLGLGLVLIGYALYLLRDHSPGCVQVPIT